MIKKIEYFLSLHIGKMFLHLSLFLLKIALDYKTATYICTDVAQIQENE